MHQKEKKILKNEGALRDLWDIVKCNNVCIIEVQEGEQRTRDQEHS